MKRLILILVMAGLLIGGCGGGGPSAEELELERKITQLEEKVAELSQPPAAAPAPKPAPAPAPVWNPTAEDSKRRGHALANDGNYEEAIEDFDEAIKLNPQLADIYDMRGAAYDSLKATRLDPTPTSTVYSINQDVIIGTIARWIVDSAVNKGNLLPKSDSRYSGSMADEKTTNGKFIKVTFTVENLSAETVRPDKPTLVDNQNREYDAIAGLGQWIPEELHWSSVSLQPNLPKQFVLIYEIPSGATGLS